MTKLISTRMAILLFTLAIFLLISWTTLAMTISSDKEFKAKELKELTMAKFAIEETTLFRNWLENNTELTLKPKVDLAGMVNDLEIKTPSFAENLMMFSAEGQCFRNLYLTSVILGQNSFSTEDVWGTFKQTLAWLKKSDLKRIVGDLVVNGLVIDGKEEQMTCQEATNYLLKTWDTEIEAHKDSPLFLELKELAGEEVAKRELRQFIFANLIEDHNDYLEQLNSRPSLERVIAASSSTLLQKINKKENANE